MGIVLAPLASPREELVRRDDLAHGDTGLALADLMEDLGHLGFQEEPVVEDHIGLDQPIHVAFAGHVEVRIHPGSHEGSDGDMLAPHVAHDIGDRAGGGHHVELAGASATVGRRATGGADGCGSYQRRP